MPRLLYLAIFYPSNLLHRKKTLINLRAKKKLVLTNSPMNWNASGNMSDRLALQLSSTGSFLYLKSGKCSKEFGLSCVTFKIYEISYFFKSSKSEESFSLPRYKRGRIWTGTFIVDSWWSVICGVIGSSFNARSLMSVSCIVNPDRDSSGLSTSSPATQKLGYLFSNFVKPPEKHRNKSL